VTDPLATHFAPLVNPLDDSDWLDVRRRARRPLARPLVLVAAVALAALLVAPALGLHRQFVEFFAGESAPERVETSFAELDIGAPPGMAPGVVADQARRVLRRRVSDRHVVTIWAAPTKAGGFCVHSQIREIGGGRRGGGSGCDGDRVLGFAPGVTIPGPISRDGTIQREPVIIDGHVAIADAESVEVRFENGEAERVPLVWISEPIDAAFFAYEVPREHWRAGLRPTAVVARDGDGRELAREEVLRGWPGPELFADLRTGVPSQAVASKQRKLLETTLPSGTKATLFVAPATSGGRCNWVRTNGGGPGHRCVPAGYEKQPIEVGLSGGGLLWGEVGDDVALLELHFEGGGFVQLRPVEGFVLYAIPPRHHRPGRRLRSMVARSTLGAEIARRDLPTGSPGVYPCEPEDRIQVGGGHSACP
jgi:hypothetical protein